MTATEQIYNVFVSHPDLWFTSNEIINMKIDKVTVSSIYNTLSVFSLKEPRYLNRRYRSHKIFEYSLNKELSYKKNTTPVNKAPDENSQEVKVSPWNPVLNSSVLPPGLKEALTKSMTPPAIGIFWTNEEKTAIAREFYNTKKKYPYLSTSSLIKKAQEVLPANRRRKYVVKAKDIPWLDSYLSLVKFEENEKILSASKNTVEENVNLNPITVGALQPDVKEPVEVKEEVMSSEPPAPEVKEVKEVKVTEQPSPEIKEEVKPAAGVTLESLSFDVIFGELVKRITSPLEAMIVKLVSSPEVQKALTVKTEVQINHHHYHHGAVPEEPEDKSQHIPFIERRAEARQPKFKIGVVTNREDMASPLAQKLTSQFPHLQFIVTARENKEAANAVKNCDKIISMTRFISHQTESHVKHVAGNKYCPVHGSESDVKRQIQLWINSSMIPKE